MADNNQTKIKLPIRNKYPFKDIKEGESFFVPCKPSALERIRANIYQSLNYHGSASYFSIEKTKKGIRVFRINKIKLKSDYKIEKNIPLPEKSIKYPFPILKIGESFWYPKEARISVSQLARYHANSKRKFISHKENIGYRCWCVPAKYVRTIKYSYKVEKNIPLPKKSYGTSYPFKLLQIGQSFFVEVSLQSVTNTKKRLSALGISYGNTKHGKGKEFTVRTYEKGVRVWRTK